MNKRKESDELEREAMSSEDQSADQEEDIIELEDIVEDIQDESLGEALSDLEEHDFGMDIESDIGELDLEIDAGRDTDLEEDPLSRFFSDEKPDFRLEEQEPEEDQDLLPPAPQENDFFMFEEEPHTRLVGGEPLDKGFIEKEEPDLMAQLEAYPLSDEELEEKPSIEEIVDRLEARLLETIQQIVETKLPDIVRTVLREEIERLREEFERSNEK